MPLVEQANPNTKKGDELWYLDFKNLLEKHLILKRFIIRKKYKQRLSSGIYKWKKYKEIE